MSDPDSIVRSILGKLNREVVPKVRRNAQKMEEFKERFRKAIEKSDSGYPKQFVHCGSAFEGLAVKEETDFDIVMTLGKPFEGANFTPRRHPSGFFTLKWKPHLPSKSVCDSEGVVNVSHLKEDLFTRIVNAIDAVKVPGQEIRRSKQLVAVTVEIKYDSGEEISIDLVPTIVFRSWEDCPDLRPPTELPECLRDYIDTLKDNGSPIMFFSLTVPNADKYQNSDQLSSPSFGLLEKTFLSSEVNLRDMVRLVKLKAHQQDWKRLYKFQSFFAKRIAVKHCDELKTKGVWEGYRAILKYLDQEVEKEFIEDYFIINQVAYKWKPERAVQFREEIARALREDPSNILSKM
ncbi:uncharacterized protein [Palaemon carinicauda]|uniref:uncharacterized protein n=1 Tax=Palaemon carinicauda TaxID=392227 RepID=UPI0035B656F8